MMKQQKPKVNQKRKKNNKDIVHIELDTKCSCPQLTSHDNAAIQFARRYLQCKSSMPTRMLRLFIETILFHSPMTKVSIFDANNRLLKDSDRLRSLKHTCSSSSLYIPLRFTLMNTVTSLAHCSCLTSSIEPNSSLSSSPTIIEQDKIEQILSTCSIAQQTSSRSTCLSSSSSDLSHSPMEISNPQTSTLSRTTNSDLDISIINRIISEYGEICVPLKKRKRYHMSEDLIQDLPLNIPLDSIIENHSVSPQQECM